jgi:hypothetical protein
MKAKIALGVELNQPVVRVVRGHKGKDVTAERRDGVMEKEVPSTPTPRYSDTPIPHYRRR